MAYSKAELRNRIMKDAGVLDFNESVQTTDADNVDELVQAAIEYLEDEDVILFNAQAGESTENIPGRIYIALADYVRSLGMSSYGVAPNEALEMSALRRLRRSALPGQDEVPVPAKFY